MRVSNYLLVTARDVAADAESVSHQLMLRAGLIRKFASGIYAYLPLGYRVLRRVVDIIEEEMDIAGAQQLLLPLIQPGTLWKESGRWDDYGAELLRFRDRKGADYVLGPTHEEVVTALLGGEVASYRQLPLLVYQIQLKFRDELRPRGGVIRSREFMMKDAYSFGRGQEDLEEAYDRMDEAYHAIFDRCGLVYTKVEADSGPIGGTLSHEFIAPASCGEDSVVECEGCGYRAKLEQSAGVSPQQADGETTLPLEEVATPGVSTIEQLVDFLGLPAHRFLKTLFYQTDKGLVAAVVRGDHAVNEARLRELLDTDRLLLASDGMVRDRLGAAVGFVGPVALGSCPVVADAEAMRGVNYVAGSNRADVHLRNVNPGRDFTPTVVDGIRLVREGDRCPRCGGCLHVTRGIEVGHLFQLGTTYSKVLGANFLDEHGASQPMVMGCYGIGVSRIPAVIVEQHHDKDGIVWPLEVAPFEAVVLPTNPETAEQAERLHGDLTAQGRDVLWDDRDVRAGVKFKDADLIGLPWKIILGKTFLREGKVELKNRRTGHVELVAADRVNSALVELGKNG